MSKSSIIKYSKYLLSFAVAIFILWYVYKDHDVDKMISNAKSADYRWIILSIILAMISHYLRAYRWKLFITPLGYNISSFRAFLAVMIGYVTNLILPRVGEIVKCGALNKLENVPVSKSFGTIITERIIDMIILIILVVTTIALEYDRLKSFLTTIFEQRINQFSFSNWFYVVAAGLLVAAILVAIFMYKNINALRKHPYFSKAFRLLGDLKEGMKSIGKIENKLAFWSSTFGIWFLYYVMSYIVVFSLPATENLTMIAGLSILAMGSIGMAAPVQGGIGAYHFMVSNLLILYGVQFEDGLTFAALLHTSQTVGVTIVGVICIFIASRLSRKPGKEIVQPAITPSETD